MVLFCKRFPEKETCHDTLLAALDAETNIAPRSDNPSETVRLQIQDPEAP